MRTASSCSGNSYTASLYLALASLLEHATDLTNKTIAFLSYGSGNVAEFFGATVLPGYTDHLRTETNRDALTRRKPIEYDRYRSLHEAESPSDGGDHTIPHETSGPFRLAAITGHKIIYESL